ncbi:MAG: hypothetical protein RMJ98_05240 [Myxococcales bacterium]|nr:hypothetical protein [Polyangiaceae bacterium]MDW8248694.1 hypothetical protein [Myxococcales bacterium]
MTSRWLNCALWVGSVACASNAPPPTTMGATVQICPEGKVPGSGGTCDDKAPKPTTSSPSAAMTRKFTGFEPPPKSDHLGDLVGHWFGEDSDGSASYELQITPDGRYTQTITTLNPTSGRSSGSCFQEGTVRRAGSQVVWFYATNTCNTDYQGREDPDELLEQSRRHFVLSVHSCYEIHYSRIR